MPLDSLSRMTGKTQRTSATTTFSSSAGVQAGYGSGKFLFSFLFAFLRDRLAGLGIAEFNGIDARMHE